MKDPNASFKPTDPIQRSQSQQILEVLKTPYQMLPKLVRQALMLLLGVPVIILGIILLPLPGPGWLVILAGLYIISIEIAWARKYVNFVKSKLQMIYDKARAKQKELREEGEKK